MIGKTLSSVQAKIVLVIGLTFVLVLAASVLMTANEQMRMAESVADNKARDLGQAYFDGLNTMMLTGNMEQKEVLRGKLMAKGDLTEIRVIHADKYLEGVVKQAEPPRDDLDRKALDGSIVQVIGKDARGRTATYIAPIRASSNYLGTNCLTCHQVPEGTVIAAIRTTYSMADLDKQTRKALIFNGAVNLILFLFGIGLVLLLLRKIVILPLLHMRQTMHRIEMESDLGTRLGLTGKDEVGALAQTINGMLDRFRDSLVRVSDTSLRLSTASDHIVKVSEQTAEAANTQRAETGEAFRFVSDLKAIALDVGTSASEAADASQEADRQAVQGTAMTREAIGGILTLVDELAQAAQAIAKLEERSHNVSEVLGIIRSIAEQTNLLALNAAIEAARAGEAGRGFAVVADEVRKLANKSHESTEKIEDIVRRLQTEAKEAVTVMDHARDSAGLRGQQLEQAVASLDMIVSRVAEIRALNQGMVQAINRQSEITGNVNAHMVSVSGIAERTADEAVQTRAMSEELVSLARELQGLVQRFKLG